MMLKKNLSPPAEGAAAQPQGWIARLAGLSERQAGLLSAICPGESQSGMLISGVLGIVGDAVPHDPQKNLLPPAEGAAAQPRGWIARLAPLAVRQGCCQLAFP
jgi:hypothetical protein